MRHQRTRRRVEDVLPERPFRRLSSFWFNVERVLPFLLTAGSESGRLRTFVLFGDFPIRNFFQITFRPEFLPSVLTVGVLVGCSGPDADPGKSNQIPAADQRGLRSAELSTRPAPGASSEGVRRPAAVIAGNPVSDEFLASLAFEAAGREILEDVTLDLLLADRLRQQGLSVTPQDVEFERRSLLNSVSRSADNTAVPGELVTRIRQDRGLGPRRFEALLTRSASLRKLVAPQVSITDQQVDTAMEVRYAERRIARIIVVPTRQEAADARREIESMAGPERSARFSQIAARVSSDPSSLRGGLLEPISVADATYPQSVRSALASLTPGGLSPVIAMDAGFALLLLDRLVPAESPPAGARDAMRTEVMLRAQRVAMERLSRDLLASANVTPFDEGLRWSWENRPAR